MTNFFIQKHACRTPQISLAISDSLYKCFPSSQVTSLMAFIICQKTNCVGFCHSLNPQTSNQKQMQNLFVSQFVCLLRKTQLLTSVSQYHLILVVILQLLFINAEWCYTLLLTSIQSRCVFFQCEKSAFQVHCCFKTSGVLC